MKYAVTHCVSSRITCRWLPKAARHAIHTDMEKYEVDSLEACKAAVRDLIDAPISELSLDAICEDFYGADLSESEALKIRDYYNGRLAMYSHIIAELDSGSKWQVLKYDIPAPYADFSFKNDTNCLSAELTIEKLED